MVRIPFVENTEDNTHCYQACIQMVLKTFRPELDYSLQDLENFTAKVKDKWTWPIASIINLQSLNIKTLILDKWGREGYERFSNEGLSFIEEYFGKDMAKVQDENSLIPQEQELTKQMLENTNAKIDPNPSILKLKNLIQSGYLIVVNVNANKLNNQEGYTGHFVLVYKIGKDYVEFHDPGIPPKESRRESIMCFKNAWRDTGDAYAFRPMN